MKKLVFVGLGAMGYPMAGHLADKAAASVWLWNRTTAKAEQCATEFSVQYSDNLADVAADADVVFTCLGRDEDVRQVLLGDAGVIALLKPGAIVVDHTTTSASLAQELAAVCSTRKVGFLDGPLSGGEEGAKNGKLTCMLGGDATVLEQVFPYLETYCASITHIGSSGAGQLTKMVNQICIAGILQGLSEGIEFAEAENLDLEKVLTAISGGAAQSWQMNNRGRTMHQREFDFGFALKWMVKDLGYCVTQAEQSNTRLDLASKVLASYEQLVEQGHAQKDTSALILSQQRNV